MDGDLGSAVGAGKARGRDRNASRRAVLSILFDILRVRYLLFAQSFSRIYSPIPLFYT